MRALKEAMPGKRGEHVLVPVAAVEVHSGIRAGRVAGQGSMRAANRLEEIFPDDLGDSAKAAHQERPVVLGGFVEPSQEFEFERGLQGPDLFGIEGGGLLVTLQESDQSGIAKRISGGFEIFLR